MLSALDRVQETLELTQCFLLHVANKWVAIVLCTLCVYNDRYLRSATLWFSKAPSMHKAATVLSIEEDQRSGATIVFREWKNIRNGWFQKMNFGTELEQCIIRGSMVHGTCRWCWAIYSIPTRSKKLYSWYTSGCFVNEALAAASC